MFGFLADPETVGIVVIAGLVVREATQMVIERFKIEARGPKVLLSVLFALAGTYLVSLSGWGEWSAETVGAIWAASWSAQAVKSIGNGGMTMEVFDCGDDEGK